MRNVLDAKFGRECIGSNVRFRIPSRKRDAKLFLLCRHSRNTTRGVRGPTDLLYASAGAYTSERRKGPASLEDAPAYNRMIDKASGTGLYTAGYPVSEFHQRKVEGSVQLDCG